MDREMASKYFSNIYREADETVTADDEKINVLRDLMATLVKACYNVKILHWKSSAAHFDSIHEGANTYSDQFNGYVDDVAEIIMMLGGQPVTLQEAAGAGIDVAIDDLYGVPAIWENMDRIMMDLIGKYEKAVKLDIPDDIADELKTQLFWIRKERYYKNVKRLAGHDGK